MPYRTVPYRTVPVYCPCTYALRTVPTDSPYPSCIPNAPTTRTQRTRCARSLHVPPYAPCVPTVRTQRAHAAYPTLMLGRTLKNGGNRAPLFEINNSNGCCTKAERTCRSKPLKWWAMLLRSTRGRQFESRHLPPRGFSLVSVFHMPFHPHVELSNHWARRMRRVQEECVRFGKSSKIKNTCCAPATFSLCEPSKALETLVS